MVISYSFGIIDFLHFGHIRLFEDARKFSNRHILGLISDAAIYSWHGTLVSSYEERLAVLQGVKYIDCLLYTSGLSLIEKNYLIYLMNEKFTTE